MNECRCGRPTRDTHTICDTCTDTLAQALGDCHWLDDELDTTIARQQGVDYRRLGGSKGGKKPAEMPSPANMAASDARTHLKGILVSWTLFCDQEHVRHSSPHTGLPADNITALSRWLLWRIDGLALHDIAPDAIDEITDAVQRCHKMIDRQPDKWYAGPCNNTINDIECGTDLYALSDHGVVLCATCGASYDVAERRAWLLTAAEDRLADATTLARSVSWFGALPLNAARVRKWAERGRIVAKAHDGDRPLYRIGDAINLMAASTRKDGAA